MRIVVVGGGPGGLGAAVPLAAAGHTVTVLDRDPGVPGTDEEAWSSWQRRSVPQLRQPHFFLARFWKELSGNAPGLRAALEAAEPAVIHFLDRVPRTAVDLDPRPGDEELVAMGFRRPVFERVLRDWVTKQPNLTLRCDTAVRGLVAEPGPGVPRVTGVELEDGSVIATDLVIAATGRHGAAVRWLQEVGAGPVEESEADGGLTYYSRYYRLLPDAEFPHQLGPPSVECGSMQVFTFPADHGTFVLAATPLSHDAEMRRIKDPDAFTRLMQLIPRTAVWLDGRAEPISDVLPLARIEDRRRRLVVDGTPAALGIVFTADAAFCTNPILGRGTSLAWLAGRRLGEVVAEHGDDAEKIALAFDEISEAEMRPWYEDSLAQDRDRFVRMDAHRRGETPELDLDNPAVLFPTALQFAGAHDAIVFRAALRRFNLLDPLDAIMGNQDALDRALAIWNRRAELPGPPPPPTRDEMLAALAG